MSRFFTLQQAERLLPSVERSVREAIEWKQQHQTAQNGLRDLMQRVMMSGGMMVDREATMKMRENWDSAAAKLQDSMNRIQDSGCLVKDLDIGLLDFPTLYRGEEVYLCWRLGETRIEFWHGVDEGFRGRKPIDDDFLRNHCGDEDT